MKSLALGLLIVGIAQAAATVTALQPPPMSPAGQQRACAAVEFNADDTVHGFCYTETYSACSGRGCQPAITYQFYDTKWNSDTTVNSFVHCGKWLSHYPGLSVWTYDPGYDVTTCYKAPYPGTGPTQTVIVGQYEQYARYLSASPDGVYGLWDVFGGSWIGEF